nr:putative ribonuclease H-like domain-containing protein [Tanacetum cinerariifolium]
NTDGDAAFDEKEPEFDEKKPESEVNVLMKRSLSLKSMFLQAVALSQKNHDDKTKREAKGNIPSVGNISPNSTNTFSVVGPSNAAASPTHGKSSCIDASQLPDDPDMPELEDITYSDDEDDVGAEADFNNLETSIIVSLIPITRVHKDHHVTQIIGSEDPDHPDKVYKVVKVLYGLRAWYETLANYLLENGFQSGKIDQTSFIKRQKSDILVIQIYVDDIIFGSTYKDLRKSFEKLMKDKFQMILMGELTFFLGFQVKQRKDGIFISHDKYVAEILRKFGLTDGKSASTPIDTEKPLLKDHDGVNTPRSDEDRLELMELTVFLLPSNEKVGVEVSVVNPQVSAVRLIYCCDDKLPVIIAKDLSVEEKTALITVLKSHKRIAWKLSDIKGIDLEFCTHKILMDEDFEPMIQHQRKVNPKI